MSGIKVKEIFKWPYKSARQVKMEDNWFRLSVTVMEDGSDYVNISDKTGAVTQDDKIISTFDCVRLHSGAAIEVAKGILKHFEINYNGYDESIKEKLKPLSDEELQKLLLNSPNIIRMNIDTDTNGNTGGKR